MLRRLLIVAAYQANAEYRYDSPSDPDELFRRLGFSLLRVGGRAFSPTYEPTK
jgi:hypothetical protein